MNHKQKGFVIPLLIIVLVIAVGGGIWFVHSKNNGSNKSATVEPPISEGAMQQVTPSPVEPSSVPQKTADQSKKPLSSIKENAIQQAVTKCFSEEFKISPGQNDPTAQLAEAVCYTKIAQANNNKLLCDSITNNTFKQQCYSKFAKTVDECAQTPYNKDSCYRDLATSQKNYLLCDKIIGNDFLTKFSCYGQVAAIVKDVSICGKIVNDNVDLGYCYTSVARAEKDPSLCEKVVETYDKVRGNPINKNTCYEFAQGN